MPRLMFLTRGAQGRDFAMPESAASVTSCSASAGNSRHRQDHFRALHKGRIYARGFNFARCDGCQDDLHRTKRQATTQDLQPIHFC